MDERKSAETPSVVEQNIANASYPISWKAKEEILGIFHVNTSSQTSSVNSLFNTHEPGRLEVWRTLITSRKIDFRARTRDP